MSKIQHLDSLQALRGIASILVLFHHLSLLTMAEYKTTFLNNTFLFGEMGVDLFFVLSGFIIYYIHHSDIGVKNKIKPFLIKRVTRIYPIYWVIFLFILPIYFIIPTFGAEYFRDFSYIVKSFLLIPQVENPLIGVAWTLTYEVFFYLLFGLLIFLNKKYSYPILFSWMAITLITFVFPVLAEKHYLIEFIFSPLNLEFIFGILVAIFLLKTRNLKISVSVLLIGITLFCFSWISEFYELFYIHTVLAWGIPSALIIYGLSSIETLRNIKVPRSLKFLGDASYSIYLTHATVMSFAVKILTTLSVNYYLSLVLIIIICVVVGCIFHLLIEKSLLKYFRTKINKKKQLIVSANIEA